MEMQLNRRHFLFGSAAAMTLAGCATKKVGLRALKPGEKRAYAMIGCGIQMRSGLLGQFLNASAKNDFRIVAVCDCDRTRAEAAAKRVNEHYKDKACRVVLDFRDVLRDPTIDAVCIATPDHWHAYMSVEAMKHGKDVYCEKPMTFSIDEAKKVMVAQKKYGRVFQNGSMQRSWREFRDACSLVRGGLIGEVMYVDANYGGGKRGGPSDPVRFFDNPAEAAKESEGYELLGEKGWDMWLGPAAWRPYSNQLAPKGVNNFYPMFWRFDDDLGSGYCGDWGAHMLDIAQWGLDMDQSGPFKIIRSNDGYSADPLHGGRRQFGMKMLFKRPYGTVELTHGAGSTWGVVFYGTKGIVAVHRGKIAVWKWDKAEPCARPTAEIRKQVNGGTYRPEALFVASIGKDYGTDALVKKDDCLAAALDKIEKEFADVIRKAGLYVSANQVENFCECVETRKPTISPSEVGGRGATLCLLCNMSYKYDTGFDWDGEAMDFPKGSNVKGLSIKRDRYRNGWEVVV